MKPYWVTFYSYKGGVGRSLALANTAALLAKQGRNVFLIDFDLEAPGLDSFSDFGVTPGQPGVVEYIYDFQVSNKPPNLTPFVQKCDLATPVPGQIWLMPSGCKDDDYNRKRTSFNFSKFYSEGVGGLFIENWKAAIAQQYKPDYVFVDSRTGLTDTGGICTLHLPDLVVLLFGLNNQNLLGTASVLKRIRKADTLQLLQVLLVATPVPNLPPDANGILTQRYNEAEKLLGVKIETSIGYNPQAALCENLFTLRKTLTPTKIENDYGNLLDKIKSYNQTGLDYLLKRAEFAYNSNDKDLASKVITLLETHYSERDDALLFIGKLKLLFNSIEEAIPFWDRALDLNPLHEGAFTALSQHYQSKKSYEKLIQLCNKVLKSEDRLNSSRLLILNHTKGECLMALQKYAEALQVYNVILKLVKDAPYNTLLVYKFNFNEAKRRLTRINDQQEWQHIINIFEKDLSAENTSARNAQANRLQAMHVAYACCEKSELAKELLEKAALCAQSVGPTENIFSLKTYTNVSPQIFLKDNAEMLKSLDSSILWDGMPIPIKKSA